MKNNPMWRVYDDEKLQQAAVTTAAAVSSQHRAAAAALCTYTKYIILPLPSDNVQRLFLSSDHPHVKGQL